MADVMTHYITARRFLTAHPQVSLAFARGLCFGSQGPDLFFFGATKQSHVFACSIHEGDPALLFSDLADDLWEKDDLYRGYALGVLLHYFGDRGIHPYVGAHCKKHPAPYAHVMLENAMDMCVYEREFGAPISSFDYDAVFHRDGKLFRAIYAFWKKRLGKGLRRGYVRRCLAQMGSLTKLFIRARPFAVKAARLYGKLTDHPAAASARFKLKADASVMNDANDEWLSPAGPSRESVEEILIRVVAEFTEMYDALEDETYRFACTETFSDGA